MEQDNNKNIIWIDFDTNTEKCLASIQAALKKSELVYVKMSAALFPNRMLDLPKSFVGFTMQNPQVKLIWNNRPPQEKKQSYYLANDCSIDKQINNVDEKIIVTMTSYPGRIKGVLSSIKLLFSNTIKPDRLVLNLSIEEFPNREDDLPQELVDYKYKERNFEIYWVNENTKPYKKTIPTLRRFPSDVIISVDDDINYPENFIETLWKYYVIYGRQCPITAGGYRWDNDIFSHYGGFSLIKKEFFGDYLDDLYENLVLPNIDSIPFADPVITYASLLNGKRYKFTIGFDMRQIRLLTHDQNKSISRIGTDDYKKKMEIEHNLIKKYIHDKYNKTYDDLFDAKINVNYTTYPLRDKYLYESLKSLQKQTLKPDNIFLWLSEDEYDKHHLPDTIQRCLDANLLTEIKWLPKNIYCHKRHNCFVQRNDEYNLDLDDDIRYKENFIEEIVSDSKKYQNCITTLASNKMLYDGTTLVKKPVSQKVSIKNNYMGGRTCFPPYLIPVGYFYDKKLNSLRDMYVPKCDEAWIRGLALKFNIMVNAIYSWKFYKFDTIEETQDTALYNENNQMTKYGIREKERNFFNAIKIFNAEDKAKEIWPNIAISDYKLLT